MKVQLNIKIVTHILQLIKQILPFMVKIEEEREDKIMKVVHHVMIIVKLVSVKRNIKNQNTIRIIKA